MTLASVIVDTEEHERTIILNNNLIYFVMNQFDAKNTVSVPGPDAWNHKRLPTMSAYKRLGEVSAQRRQSNSKVKYASPGLCTRSTCNSADALRTHDVPKS